MKWLRTQGWRHAVALVACVFALFPVWMVIVSAFNDAGSLTSTSLWPDGVSLANFRILFDPTEAQFLRWFVNSLTVATVASVLSVAIAALAAYAFSRLRFKGRKVGLLTLIIVQMFPAFLALVAIYLILSQISDVAPALGINALGGIILVYLGGALGVNAWLIKGFFDTIPIELDESATIDGASHSQIFWIVILPLAAPVLAVTALLAFIGTLNEFILATTLLQESNVQTLAVGLRTFINGQYGTRWGAFAAGALIAAVPVVVLFLVLQKYIISGLTGGAVKG